MPITAEQVTEFSATLDANSDGKVRSSACSGAASSKIESLTGESFLSRAQVTVEDFFLLLLKESSYSTIEELEADMNSDESELVESLADLKSQLTALLD